jgi:hypothetical protein
MVLAANTTVEVVFTAVVLGAGYVGLWALWHFVFREKKKEDT